MSTACIESRVSNGTGQGNFSGQRDRSFFIVPGQRDNGTSSKSCHGTGRDGIFDMLSRPVPGRPGTITKWRMTDRLTKKDAKGIQKLMMYHAMMYHVQCGLSMMYHDPGQMRDRRKMSKKMHFFAHF